jgi:hypothetical protein
MTGSTQKPKLTATDSAETKISNAEVRKITFRSILITRR